ncbi:histidine phosphatase family protein [Hyphomicrobium sp. CS1GBMeth3]|uniref:histidine phosphatase family protein n=1 Tax=Hyphomicrobium sp. CS1GBMeth3 TaxID=1892845 RepID=UPI00093069F8|nr:histidine phosphatase family protein [Hyphomicrobium sp. CS1GBMeth3]
MPDRPTIYFIRHGETDWNRELRYQGQRDIPLNDTGRAQARRNGETLRQFLPVIAETEFIASPLGRARETMEIIRAELGLPPSDYAIEPRLVELCYGAWEGTLQADIKRDTPEAFAARSRDPFRWRPDKGESYADLFVRVSAWAGTRQRDSVIVSHGGVSRCLRAYVLGLDPAVIPELESPQDRVLILGDGAMRWL